MVGTGPDLNHLSPFGERQRPVHAGDSAQWVAWKLWSYTIRQQRPASAMKPGETSPGWGIGVTGARVDPARDPNPEQAGVGLEPATFHPPPWTTGSE